MSREDDTPAERQITTDRENIERWAGEHEATPVRRRDDDTIELVTEAERRDDHEELTWDDFHGEIERNDMVVGYHEDAGSFDVMARDEMMSRHTVDVDDVETALLEGETVTATVTETTVVEQTIVEEATLESEVVDRETVEETFVDAELITREVDHCEVTDVGGLDTITDETMLANGYEFDDEVTVEVEVDEGWTVTKEQLDQLTIETRIVDTEATETDTVESNTLEETIDIEGVQETILEGDLLDSDAQTAGVIESGAIESDFREGDVVETTMLERNTIEEEVSLRKEYSGAIGNGRTRAVDTINRQTIESEIAEDEDLEAVVVEEDVTAEADATMAEEETVVGEEETMVGEEETVVAEEETVVADDDADVVEEETTVADADVDERPMPAQADEGKTVVDATGEEIGMVTEVENDTIFVDPHPSLTDRIKTVLDWGGHDDDAYPLRADHIASITDDEVQLAVDEETER